MERADIDRWVVSTLARRVKSVSSALTATKGHRGALSQRVPKESMRFVPMLLFALLQMSRSMQPQ